MLNYRKQDTGIDDLYVGSAFPTGAGSAVLLHARQRNCVSTKTLSFPGRSINEELSIYLPFYLSVYPSIYPSIHLSIYTCTCARKQTKSHRGLGVFICSPCAVRSKIDMGFEFFGNVGAVLYPSFCSDPAWQACEMSPPSIAPPRKNMPFST